MNEIVSLIFFRLDIAVAGLLVERTARPSSICAAIHEPVVCDSNFQVGKVKFTHVLTLTLCYLFKSFSQNLLSFAFFRLFGALFLFAEAFELSFSNFATLAEIFEGGCSLFLCERHFI